MGLPHVLKGNRSKAATKYNDLAEAAVTYLDKLDNLDKVPVPFVTSESVDFYNSEANKRSEGSTFSFHLLGSSLLINYDQSVAEQRSAASV